MTSDYDLATRLEEGRTSGTQLRWQVTDIHREAAARIRELEAELEELRGFYSKYSMVEHKLDRGTHVIVPVEPTDAMICHGLIGLEGGQHSDGLFAKEMADAYRAMIRAAQDDAKRQQGE